MTYCPPYDGAKGRLESCVVARNGEAGVFIMGGASPLLVACK